MHHCYRALVVKTDDEAHHNLDVCKSDLVLHEASSVPIIPHEIVPEPRQQCTSKRYQGLDAVLASAAAFLYESSETSCKSAHAYADDLDNRIHELTTGAFRPLAVGFSGGEDMVEQPKSSS